MFERFYKPLMNQQIKELLLFLKKIGYLDIFFRLSLIKNFKDIQMATGGTATLKSLNTGDFAKIQILYS